MIPGVIRAVLDLIGNRAAVGVRGTVLSTPKSQLSTTTVALRSELGRLFLVVGDAVTVAIDEDRAPFGIVEG